MFIYFFCVENEKIYSWGANLHGQVGNNQTSKGEFSPVEINLPEPFRLRNDKESSRNPFLVHPIRVTCGGSNSSILVKELNSDRKYLFVWGSRKDGKLGLGEDEDKLVPTLLNSLENPIFIDSGCDHSVSIDSNSNIWGWGFSQHYSLGKGNERNDLSIPHQLPLGNITQILCGQDDTFFCSTKY